MKNLLELVKYYPDKKYICVYTLQEINGEQKFRYSANYIQDGKFVGQQYSYEITHGKFPEHIIEQWVSQLSNHFHCEVLNEME